MSYIFLHYIFNIIHNFKQFTKLGKHLKEICADSFSSFVIDNVLASFQQITNYKSIELRLPTIMTNTADEKLCLQWNDFKENVSSAFGDLRQDKELTDVTLVCEDGQQVEAHKVVLVASSPFFQNVLKKNKHPHPLIYMRGMRPENLMAMVDFFYYGEANVYQENLDSFLVLAEELQLKGLRGNQTEKEEEDFQKPTKQKSSPKSQKYRLAANEVVCNENGAFQPATEKTLVLKDEASNNTNMESLDQQVKSIMLISENDDPYLIGRKARICKVCGKEGSMQAIMSHIEANHIAGIPIPCGLCGQYFKTKNSLRTHKSRHHKNQ